MIMMERGKNMWRKLDETERGIAFLNCDIIADEEYKDCGRITVEKIEDNHIAIVCSIYGSMIQSVSCDENEYPLLYETMRTELAELFEREGSTAEKTEEYLAFFKRHATLKVYRRKINEL